MCSLLGAHQAGMVFPRPLASSRADQLLNHPARVITYEFSYMIARTNVGPAMMLAAELASLTCLDRFTLIASSSECKLVLDLTPKHIVEAGWPRLDMRNYFPKQETRLPAVVLSADLSP